jgi:bifunctional UDP-N-acetylglucosamine pyrophosphorylase/glucosamine-1-phosphate N-acetyltransferase
VASGAAVTVLSMRVPEPRGYGRILRDDQGGLTAIVEDRDASEAERRIDEVNSGVYAFRYPALAEALSGLAARNAQGEYYLTDTVALMARRGLPTSVVCADDYRELLGINTVEQLAEAERLHRELGREGAR